MQKAKFIQKGLILVALAGMVYLGWQIGHTFRIELTPYRPVILTKEIIEFILQTGFTY